jgi:signal transduction histidine kinase
MTDPDTEVEEILREACGHLARSLDLLSRVLHPAAPADIGPISVREPVAFIADLHHAGRNRARLEHEVDPAIPAAAGVERHLEHALLNLVLNATHALQSRDGGVIRLTAHRQGDQVEIAVADNGPGVPAERVAALFEPPATEASRPITGAGLAVARELLRLSGGTLTYAPGPEGGARFAISLPVWTRVAAPRR